jgi:hypothetical protein
MRTTDYGKKIGSALKAIASMHSQVSKLLMDCDGLFPEYESMFGNIATRDLTYNVKANFWMARGVYRYWIKEASPVIGVAAMFYSSEDRLEQPLLVVGQIQYLEKNAKTIKELCDPWHLWYGVMDWAQSRSRIGDVIELSDPDGKGTIHCIRFIAFRLFHIESLEDVKYLFNRVGVEFSK